MTATTTTQTATQTGKQAEPPQSQVRVRGTHLDEARNEAAKYVALVLMVANHLLLAFPDPWRTAGHLLGRPCVALFAFILASRLAEGGPDRARRAFVWLAIWGAVAQPVYYALTGMLVIRADVLFTLALGVGAVWLIEKRWWIALGGVAMFAAFADRWLDGGALTAAAMAGAFILWRRGQTTLAIWTATGLMAVQNLWASPHEPWAAAAVFAAPLILLLSPYLSRVAPRAPRWAFYAFYPAHLLVIFLVFGPYHG